MELWQQQAKQAGGDDLVTKIEQMASDIHEIKGSLADYSKAFAGNDLDGHRRYHEAVIERTAELRRLRVAIQEKTISGLVWVVILWLGHRLIALVAPRLGLFT